MSVSGTGLPSAVDEAREADGTLPRWKKNEMGKDVRPELDELSGSGPAVEDRGLVEEEDEEGSSEVGAVGLGDVEWPSCSLRRQEEASALAASASSAVASRGRIGRGACGVLYLYKTDGRRARFRIKRAAQAGVAPCSVSWTRGSSRRRRTAQQAGSGNGDGP